MGGNFIVCPQGLNYEQGRALYTINILCEVSSTAQRNLTIDSIYNQMTVFCKLLVHVVFSERSVALMDCNNHKIVD